MHLQPKQLAAALCAALLAPLSATGQTTATTGSHHSSASHSMSAASWYDDRWYVTPLVGYTWADDMRHADSGMNVGLAIGKPISPNLNLELRTLYEKLDG